MKSTLSLLVIAIGLDLSLAADQTSSNYQAVVSAQSPSSYFKLDGSLA